MTDDHTDTLRVYLIVNGPLGMSPGKIASQCFQACQRMYAHLSRLDHSSRSFLLKDWEEHTATIVRVAKTPTMFERICAEIEGIVMVDEGYTEVPAGSRTVFASWPMRKSDAPALLNNKKIPLL